MLKPKEDREISQGFPWVYDNEISTVKFPLKIAFVSEITETTSYSSVLLEETSLIFVGKFG